MNRLRWSNGFSIVEVHMHDITMDRRLIWVTSTSRVMKRPENMIYWNCFPAIFCTSSYLNGLRQGLRALAMEEIKKFYKNELYDVRARTEACPSLLD